MISSFYTPDGGQIRFKGEDITEVRADQIARIGIARTFQNIELFEHSTVLQNLLIGREIHSRVPVLRQLIFDPGVRRAELVHRAQVEDVIDFLELAHYRDERIANLPYGVRKKLNWGGLCALSRNCCCSTNQPRASIPKKPKIWVFGLMTLKMIWVFQY